MFRSVKFLAKRPVPINCRKPTEESTRLTRREKLDWAGYIAILTIVPIGLQLWQFNATSAVRVNADVMEELGRRTEPSARSTVREVSGITV
jgi:hypothetical protein